MENKSSFETFKNWIQNSIAVKLFVILFVMILLMIPKSMIRDLIFERQRLSDEVSIEVSQKWGGSQTVTGPILKIPFEKSFFTDKDKETPVITNHYAYFLPEKLEFDSKVNVNTDRGRSIYKAMVYKSEIGMNGHFKIDLEKLNLTNDQMLWDEAKVILGISDLKGISNAVGFQLDGQKIALDPGIPNSKILSSGLNGNVVMDEAITDISFEGNVELQGSRQLYFAPLGKYTTTNMRSAWPSPSFDGYFVPATHNITEQGFTSNWEVYALSRNITQQFIDSNENISSYNYGVQFVDPVNLYSKSHRTSKYALLLISLTFLTFLFFEVLQKKHMHPIQYVLVGLALTVFYVLLLSLSEHIGFNRSYMIASGATIGLIALYTSSIFKSWKLTGALSLLLLAIFSFVFVILQLESYALLAGSIGLFVILAIVMLSTRKLNWYTFQKE